MDNTSPHTFQDDSDSDDYFNYSDRDPDIEYVHSFTKNLVSRRFTNVPTNTLTFTTLAVDQVEELLNTEVASLCYSTNVPPSIARHLLISNAWDVEKVKVQYLQDPVKVLITQKLIPPASNTKCTPAVSDSPAVMESLRNAQQRGFPVAMYLVRPTIKLGESCSVCTCTPPPTVVEFFSTCPDKTPSSVTQSTQLGPDGSGPDAPTNHLYGLSCGHRFCVDCWSHHMIMQVGEEGNTQISCMDCNLLVPEDFLLAILKGSPAKDKYLSFIFRRMVRTHPSLRSCIGTDCPMIIRALEPAKLRRICCSHCQTQMCFVCNQSYHAPTDCEVMKLWLGKCHDDMGTATYMAAHTKDCPKCHVCIEKNGGCNHVACTVCKCDFCWVCLGPWSEHSTQYYQCSRYVAGTNTESDETRLEARESLKRYVFYYERWANHDYSLRLEKDFRQSVFDRIQERVLNRQGTWIDWQHLLTAADTLRDCRYTLQYTYPMAYFSEKLVNKDLFEYQQAILEVEVESLAWKIEHSEITDRAALQNAMEVCEKHRLNLLQKFSND